MAGQQQAVFQAVWPSFPLAVPYHQVSVPNPNSYLQDTYGSLVLQPGVIPCCFYNTVIQNPSPMENRILFLDRSVFDLVEAHAYLELTDPKLLGWYLCLSQEDRKIIQDEGGFHLFLQRHPALQLSRHHVYVKYNMRRVGPAQPATTTCKQTSRTSGAKKCICGLPDAQRELELLPNNVRETLSRLGCSCRAEGSQKHPPEGRSQREQLVHVQDGLSSAYTSPNSAYTSPNTQEQHTLQGAPLYQLGEESPLWQMAFNSSVCEDPVTMATSYSLDLQPERLRPEAKPEVTVTQGQGQAFTYTEGTPIQTEWPTVEKASSPSDCYIFGSAHVNTTSNNDSSTIQPIQPEPVKTPLNRFSADENEASLSSEDQSDGFHCVMADDQSILMCLASENLKPKSDQSSVVKTTDTADKSTSPMMAIVTTCDIMVGTEIAPHMATFSQTEEPKTSDKHVITEVHMADLDYLAEEFIKLKMVEAQMKAHKEKMKGSGGKPRKDCECVHRAQQAELSLLALQHHMCTQHLWRLYSNSTEGSRLTAMPKDPPPNILSVQQTLECDYNQMRAKILSGVPLDKLKPLSVDCELITMGTRYTPAQISVEVQKSVPSSSPEPQKQEASEEESPASDNQSKDVKDVKDVCQDSEKEVKPVRKERVRRAVTLVPRDRDGFNKANRPGERQSSGGKELNSCEDWYDAEEDLEQTAATETRQEPTGNTHVEDTLAAPEPVCPEVQSAVLCVSNLPTDVTESDVKQWFEKYQVCEVSISALNNDWRVAIVMLSGSQCAEAAVTELNGSTMHGRTLRVEHININTNINNNNNTNITNRAGSAVTHNQSPAQSESSQDLTTPHTLHSTDRKLLTHPPLSSVFKPRQVVCISPTAKGTCVPQHYGTMGSFDTLMAELTQRHPHVARESIVDALTELKAKHCLSTLPLRTIREMTSEILSRSANEVL